MTTLTSANKKFYNKLKKVVKKWPDATLQLISDVTGNTLGSVSWSLSILKKAKYVKRDRKGNLVTLK